MFYDCKKVESLDVGHFNTSRATNMESMFFSCNELTALNLVGFNTSSVTNMTNMFRFSNKLTTICVDNTWSTSNVSQSTGMFTGCTSLVGGMGTTYNANYTDKSRARIDGGTSNPGYLTEKPKEAYVEYTSSNKTLTFYYDKYRYLRTGTTGPLDLDRDPEIEGRLWDEDEEEDFYDATCVVFDQTFADARPHSTAWWFSSFVKLETITGLYNLNTSEVIYMNYMFSECRSLKYIDLSNFNTSNVTDMTSMFLGCNSLTSLVLSSFNTSNVTSMYGMFNGCESLNLINLNSFNTANVTNMNGMFIRCSNLTSLDVSSFNTDNVTTMENMFDYCSSLTNLDLSRFNTSNVTTFGFMFLGCSSMTILDLSSFNTANVTYTRYMFYGCSNLVTIYVGDDWNISSIGNSDYMFTDCTRIVGSKGTIYNPSRTDKSYAHIDGGYTNPGYLSEKVDGTMGDVSGDGVPNITDVTLLINAVLNSDFSNIITANADLNGDGSINITDITLLIAMVLNV